MKNLWISIDKLNKPQILNKLWEIKYKHKKGRLGLFQTDKDTLLISIWNRTILYFLSSNNIPMLKSNIPLLYFLTILALVCSSCLNDAIQCPQLSMIRMPVTSNQSLPTAIDISNRPINIQLLKNNPQLSSLTYQIPLQNKESTLTEMQYTVLPSDSFILRKKFIEISPRSGFPDQDESKSTEISDTELRVLKGVQKLVKESNNKVIGKLSSMEEKINRVINGQNSIIGSLNMKRNDQIGATNSIANKYGSKDFIDYSKPPLFNSISNINVGMDDSNSIYSTDQSTNCLIGQVISPSIYSQSAQGKNQNSLKPNLNINDDSKIKSFSQMQKRIDNLEEEMLIRQKQTIMSRLNRDYQLGQMGTVGWPSISPSRPNSISLTKGISPLLNNGMNVASCVSP